MAQLRQEAQPEHLLWGPARFLEPHQLSHNGCALSDVVHVLGLGPQLAAQLEPPLLGFQVDAPLLIQSLPFLSRELLEHFST